MKNWDFKFDPPEEHELDGCKACHDEDKHISAIEHYAEEGCEDCDVILEQAIEDGRYCLEHKHWYCEE